MSYTAELKQRYALARKRLGMGPTVPVVRAATVGRVAPAVAKAAATNPQPATTSTNILPFVLTLEPLDAISEDELKPIAAWDIVKATADAASVSIPHLLGQNRCRKLSKYRQVAMYLLATLKPEMSYPSIGRLLKRDHTTVMFAHTKVRNNMADFSKQLTAIMDRLI